MLRFPRPISLVVFACLAAALPALASDDRVQFGQNIHVAAGESVGDIVCFACSVDVEGAANGDLVVFLGSTHLHSGASTRGDTVTFGGNLRVDSGVAVGGDSVVFAGNQTMEDGSSIRGDAVVFGGRLDTADHVYIQGSRVVQPALFLWGPLLLFIAVVILLLYVGLQVVRRNRYVPVYPPPPPTV